MCVEGKSCSYALDCAGLPVESSRLATPPVPATKSETMSGSRDLEVWMNQGFMVHLPPGVPECFSKCSDYRHTQEGAKVSLVSTGVEWPENQMPLGWPSLVCPFPPLTVIARLLRVI